MMLCPVCNAQTDLLDVVDFNKSCEEARGKFLPISGIPIYYSRCSYCSFIFAPEFANWTEIDFLEKIYNDQYIEIDPDYLETRPKANFQTLKQLFSKQKKLIKHLDYGGGNGKLSILLKQDGWDSETYDPFPSNNKLLSDLGKYNLITAFEVFEHVPDINLLMKNLTEIMTSDCLVLFSTLVSDGNIKKNRRIDWWYASPRNGHINLFSKQSLMLLGSKNALSFSSFSNGFHCYSNQVPHWANHIKQFINPSIIQQKNQLPDLIKQGLALHQKGKYGEAQAIYEQALEIQDDHFDALQLLGALSAQTKQLTKAVDYLTKALQINPDHAACYSNRGIALKELGRLNEALASYDQAISIKPDYADAYSNRGIALKELGRLEEALESCDKAIQLNPDYADAYSNRGIALKELGRLEEALESCDKAIQLNPDYAAAYSNRGIALKELGRLNEALASYDQAISIKPDYAHAYSNRGNTLKELGRLEEALESYKKSISLKPDNANVYWNLSLCHLLGGNFKDGWQGYEWRWQSTKISKIAGARNFSGQLWLGSESLTDKTILLYAEQGLGDTIQFCRYVPLVAELGAKVILEVQRPLVGLLKNIEGVNKIIAKGDTLTTFDFQCPLLSLPLAFKTELHTIPPVSHHITSDENKVAKWQTKLGKKGNFRVGLVWSGSTIHEDDHNRSLSLAQIVPHLPSHLDYVCLQKELRGADQALLAQRNDIKYFGDALEDFTDTAALCELMDVVISVDTSVAHLAGTMGRPTWVLLPFGPDWRWLLNRDDSPWYSSIKLYRQDKVGDWSSVLRKIKADLASK